MATLSGRGANRDGRMSLAQHLRELRSRLVVSAFAILAFSIGGWFVADFIWNALRLPIIAVQKAHHATLNYPDITSAFDLKFQIAVTVGIIVASPIWLYEVFAFLVPGLTGREKRYTFGFFFTAIPLFLGGCLAGWYVFPHIVELLTSFVPKEDSSFIVADNYLSFVMKLMLAVGIAFVLPVFLVLLNFIGILSARSILRSWRIAVLIISIFCAIATPAADIISMFLLAIPMVLLYFGAAFVAFVHDRGVARRAAQLNADFAV